MKMSRPSKDEYMLKLIGSQHAGLGLGPSSDPCHVHLLLPPVGGGSSSEIVYPALCV